MRFRNTLKIIRLLLALDHRERLVLGDGIMRRDPDLARRRSAPSETRALRECRAPAAQSSSPEPRLPLFVQKRRNPSPPLSLTALLERAEHVIADVMAFRLASA
jgi:hypothetical protein